MGTERSYPESYLEALAYHEAGHAVMAVLLGVRIEKVVIGPACKDEEHNGRVFLHETGGQIPAYVVVLMAVASETAEQLAPAFAEASSLHKTHKHLTPFRNGVRNDLAQGFEVAAMTYGLMGHAESTARRLFKAEYRDLAAHLIALCERAVHRVARKLKAAQHLGGEEVVEIVTRACPGRRTDEGRWLAAALGSLQFDSLNLAAARRLACGQAK